MNENNITILLVEDNPGDARLLGEMLKESSALKTELTRCGSMNDAMDHLVTNPANIILLDLGLPDAQGLEAVRQVHAAAPGIPLVVLTGFDDEALATQSLREGAQDYLIKGQIENHTLLRTIRYAIERQRMQAETEQVRKLQLQLKDEFLSHVSHELRSPLTAIHQFGTILADELAGGVNTEQREYLQVILRNVGQLQSMIGDLLDVTRAQEGKLTIDPQCTSVGDAVTYTVKTLQGTANVKEITLNCEVPRLLPMAYADPTRLQQILIILLDNAIKFTPAGGAVTVRAKLVVEEQCSLLLEIEDSGCGIDPDLKERIFERLFQVTEEDHASRKGLGLGLYICKELVVRQGGHIWVENAPQKGSVFSFTLPIFSLAELISPFLKNEEWPSDSVALVTVDVCSPNGWPSRETRDEWSRDTRSVLQRCLLPDLDVLLPKMGPSSGSGETFQVIAFADEKGVAVLTKRIREQFQRLNHGKKLGLIFSTSYRLLECALANPGPAVADAADEDNFVDHEQLTEGMAARIQDLINSETAARIIPS